MSACPLVVWNPSAGQASHAHEVRRQLERAADCELLETPSPADAEQAIRAAVNRGCRRVIAAGGDGTANQVLQTLVRLRQSDVSAAVLPMGTGNDLARSLGMPLDPTEAIPLVFQPANAGLDVFRCCSRDEERVLVNMCTSGNTGLYLQKLTPEIKQRWGPFCYLRGVVDVLADLRAFDVQLTWDDGRMEQHSVLNLFLANGRTTGAGLSVVDCAQLDDRRLEVVIVLDGAAAEIAALTADYLLNDFLQHPLVIHRQTSRLRVQSRYEFPVTIDGDVFTTAPFDVELFEQQIPIVAGDSPAVKLTTVGAAEATRVG